MVNLNNLLTLFICLIPVCLVSQMDSHQFKRTINGVNDLWHQVVLPNDIFEKTSTDFSDVRIYGVNVSGDTIEAPYFLDVNADRVSTKKYSIKQLNSSHSKNGFHYTFEMPQNAQYNRLNLNIKQKNFDWRLILEGSNNQTEWFTIIDDYRIVSIKNNVTSYSFTDVVFPLSNYRYTRLTIKSVETPQIANTSIALTQIDSGKLKVYNTIAEKHTINKASKQSTFDIDLEFTVPVSILKVNISDSLDFYRPLSIQYLHDSFKTDKGWKYNYRTISRKTINRLESSTFSIPTTRAKKLRLIIDNHDNQPLTIKAVSVCGYQHALIGRFHEQADYALFYGNDKLRLPNYDIHHFKGRIPKVMRKVSLGSEIQLFSGHKPITGPLFSNKMWLYGIMTIIILVLAWFTLKMMKTSDN